MVKQTATPASLLVLAAVGALGAGAAIYFAAELRGPKPVTPIEPPPTAQAPSAPPGGR